MVFRRLVGLAAVAIAMIGGPGFAQTADENRDADALAADMRILAGNPLNIEALIVAGELTLKMGDNTAAAGFFIRAEKLDPLNPRIKAGWGVLMVRAERPGDALRRFREAETRGLDPRKYAAERGLAYDLIGEQDRAQRDYRLSLQSGPNDEVTRRYALSLGISGNKKLALDLLDPLLRRSDRAAWRDRAFILAMSGDTAGAQKIAETMMSPGLGAGLSPFFQRLPTLSPADRAFAVTFGETRATPERLADARLTPVLPKLGPDPTAPKIEVAAAEPVKLRFADDDKNKKKKKKRKDGDLAPAVPTPSPPVEVALNPPTYVAPRPAPAPVFVPTPTPIPAPRVAAKIVPVPAPPPARLAEAPKPAPTPAPLPPPVKVEPPKPTPIPAVAPPPPTPAPEPVKVATVEPRAEVPTEPVADQPSAAEAGVSPTATSRVSEDTVLAKIIAGISVPGSELGVAPMPVRAVPSPPAPKPAETAPEPKARAVEPPKTMAKPTESKPVRGKTAKDEPVPESDVKGGKLGKGKADTVDVKGAKGKAAKDTKDDEVALDKYGCPLPVKGKPGAAKGKAAIETKSRTTSTRGKTPDKCKTLAAKEKDKADAAIKGDAARIWVQVAGGANETSLEKAWAAQKAKAPDLFRSRQGWTTPLRNTNRVLTGPFKSADEAQAFVNQMAKAGLSGFVFTSTKGQKVDRLGSK